MFLINNRRNHGKPLNTFITEKRNRFADHSWYKFHPPNVKSLKIKKEVLENVAPEGGGGD